MVLSVRSLIDKYTAPPIASLVLACAGTGCLVFALIMQYGFDLHPCILCLWQRVPFACSALCAVAAIFFKGNRRIVIILLGLCAAAYFINTGLAVFHTGVERHWWLGTSGCAIHPLSGASVEDIRTQLLHTVVARCDEIAWTFLGLSMANWNVPLSLSLAFYSYLAMRKVTQ